MTKRFLAALTMLGLAFALAACGGAAKSGDTNSGTGQNPPPSGGGGAESQPAH